MGAGFKQGARSVEHIWLTGLTIKSLALGCASEPKDSIRAHRRKLGSGLIKVWSSDMRDAHAVDEMLPILDWVAAVEDDAAIEIRSRLH
jgi:hypothetical protein